MLANKSLLLQHSDFQYFPVSVGYMPELYVPSRYKFDIEFEMSDLEEFSVDFAELFD